MKLSESINQNLIEFKLEANEKNEVIDQVIQLLAENQVLTDPEQYRQDVLARESQSTTGIGMGIAIPHAKSSGVKETSFTLVRLAREVEWQSLDDKPVNYVIMLAVPDSAKQEFLKLLSQLSTLLMEDDFREGLQQAESVKEIIELFKTEEEKLCLS
ncbi:PTS sugar transporter subunit IIA [Enterococcus sp. LJL90]